MTESWPSLRSFDGFDTVMRAGGVVPVADNDQCFAEARFHHFFSRGIVDRVEQCAAFHAEAEFGMIARPNAVVIAVSGVEPADQSARGGHERRGEDYAIGEEDEDGLILLAEGVFGE